MSIKSQWIDAQRTTILQVFDRTWTDAEFETQYRQVQRWVNSVDHEVNLIIDLQHLDVKDAAKHIISRKAFPKKLHSVVVVNEDKIFLKALLPLVNRITPPTKKSPIVIVEALDQAYEVLGLHHAGV